MCRRTPKRESVTPSIEDDELKEYTEEYAALVDLEDVDGEEWSLSDLEDIDPQTTVAATPSGIETADNDTDKSVIIGPSNPDCIPPLILVLGIVCNAAGIQPFYTCTKSSPHHKAGRLHMYIAADSSSRRQELRSHLHSTSHTVNNEFKVHCRPF